MSSAAGDLSSMADGQSALEPRPVRRGGSVRIRAPGEQSMGRKGSSRSPRSSPHSSQGDLASSSGPVSEENSSSAVGFASPGGADEDGAKDGDDTVSSAGEAADELPFPGLNDTVFHCMSQTSKPRIWCIQLVCWPYPFSKMTNHFILI